MVCYVQHSLIPFHQQVTFRASLVGHFKKSICLVRALPSHLFREPILNPSSWLEVILLPTERCQDVCGDWPHWALFQCLSLVLWTKCGYRQYSALHCMLSKSLTCLWGEKNEKWRTLSCGMNHTLQWVKKCPACSSKTVLSLGQLGKWCCSLSWKIVLYLSFYIKIIWLHFELSLVLNHDDFHCEGGGRV